MANDNDNVLEGALKHFAEIGPRPHGSSGNDNAVDFTIDRLESLGFEVVVEDFEAPIPQNRDGATLLINGKAVPCVPFLESPEGTVTGQAVKAENCLVWGMHDWEVWTVESSETRAAVAVSNFPSAVQQHIPSALRVGPCVIISTKERDQYGLTGPDSPTVEVTVSAPLRTRRGRSLRAFRGPDPLDNSTASPHPMIVAHIDTVPDSPGVYDNATGVAAAISVCARYGKAPFEVLITSGEEEGLAGARAFAKRVLEQRVADQISLAVTLDGGGRGSLAEAWFSEAVRRELQDRFITTATARGYDTTVVRPAPPASDHAAFTEVGIPALMYTVNDLEILHTPDDVYEDSKLRSAELLAELAMRTIS